MNKFPAKNPQQLSTFVILQQRYPKSSAAIALFLFVLLIFIIVQNILISNRLNRIETPTDIEQEDVPLPDEEDATPKYVNDNPSMEANVLFAENVIGDHSIERREKYYDSEYDQDGFPTGKLWLSNDEFKGDHITNSEIKSRFKKRKSERMKHFVAMVTIRAKQIGAKYEIPWKVIVAQAIVESAYGMSRVAVTGYNLFGHKLTPAEKQKYQAEGTKGLSKGISGFIPAYDDNPDDLFRQYNNYWVGMERHAQLLKDAYAPNGNFPQCLCSGKRKYATNCGNGYVEKIQSVMDKIK